MTVLPTSNTTERLTYLTSSKDIYILELPFLEQKRKIKLKKDSYKISCFESCHNGKIALTGTEDGAVQIVADPSCYWCLLNLLIFIMFIINSIFGLIILHLIIYIILNHLPKLPKSIKIKWNYTKIKIKFLNLTKFHDKIYSMTQIFYFVK